MAWLGGGQGKPSLRGGAVRRERLHVWLTFHGQTRDGNESACVCVCEYESLCVRACMCVSGRVSVRV